MTTKGEGCQKYPRQKIDHVVYGWPLMQLYFCNKYFCLISLNSDFFPVKLNIYIFLMGVAIRNPPKPFDRNRVLLRDDCLELLELLPILSFFTQSWENCAGWPEYWFYASNSLNDWIKRHNLYNFGHPGIEWGSEIVSL